MTDPIIWVFAAGIGVVVFTLIRILRWDAKVPATESINDPTQLQYWTEQANIATQDFGLGATRAAGEKWAASIAGILGFLSAVAFVAGPSSLVEDVGGPAATIAAGLILAAAGVASVATLLAALAEHGTPVAVEDLDGPKYRTLLRTRAARAAEQIRWSRILIVVTLVLMLAATGTAWLTALTSEAEETGQSVLVTSSAGTQCGTLSREEGAVVLQVGEAAEPIPTGATVTPVDSCPE